MSDFHEGYILKAKSVVIQGDRLIPTNTYWAPLNSGDNMCEKIGGKVILLPIANKPRIRHPRGVSERGVGDGRHGRTPGRCAAQRLGH